MTLRRVVATAWLAGVAGACRAAPVPVSYTITTKGTGPGSIPVTTQTTFKLVDHGECNLAKFGVFDGHCLTEDTVLGPPLTNVAGVPVGETNATVNFSGGDMYVLLGTWGGVGTGGVTGCGTGGSSCSFSVRLPAGGPYSVVVGFGYAAYDCNAFWCSLGCFLPGCLGYHPDQATTTVTYQQTSGTAPKECTQTGTGQVEANGAWHLVASAGCMQAPDIANGWTGTANMTGSGTGAEVEAVMTSVNPNGATPPFPPGPQLWVKAKPSCEGCSKPVAGTFKQCNPAWKNEFLDGSNKTICKAGCLMVCMGMILGIDPNEMNVDLSINDFFVVSKDPKLDGNMKTKKAVKFYDMAYKKVEAVSATPDAIRLMLCDPATLGVIAEVCSVGDPTNPEKSHFVVVTGEVPGGSPDQPCRFTIADPASSSKVFLDEYTDICGGLKSVRRMFK